AASTAAAVQASAVGPPAGGAAPATVPRPDSNANAQNSHPVAAETPPPPGAAAPRERPTIRAVRRADRVVPSVIAKSPRAPAQFSFAGGVRVTVRRGFG